jgi:hypothetical protein
MSIRSLHVAELSGVWAMQQFGGWLLLLSGVVALGGYLTLPPAPDDISDPAEVSHVSIVPYHARRPGEPATRTFSPASATYRDALNADVGQATPARQPASATWAATVISEPSRTATLRSAKPADARTRFELARDLQRELKRAGCYWGDINGLWNPSTRRAMSAFMDRANATLPIKSPDYILLTLVETRREISCSSGCPSGQTMDQSGRCMPHAVMTQASKRSKRPETRDASNARAVADPASVATVKAEQLPWLDRSGRSIVAETSPRAMPPPGMMSVGGPDSRVGTSNPTLSGEPPSQKPLAQRIVIERDDRMVAESADATDAAANPEKLASLSADGDDASPAATTEFAPAVKSGKSHRAKHEREWRDERPRRSAYGGRSRRGDPRPGTMRYNVAQVLGGIY